MAEEKLKITPKRPKGEDGYRTFSIRIREEAVAEIENISSKTGRTRNELINAMLEYALKNYVIESSGNDK